MAKELGPPFELSRRGRPQEYDPIRLAAAILVKGMRSFVSENTDRMVGKGIADT